MKNKDKKELHARSEIELRKMLSDGRELLAMLRLDHAQKKLKKTRDIFNTRQKIAIIESILRQKELMKNV